MLKEPGAHQHALEMVTLESLAPSDHLLRHIDAFIDIEFIRDKVRHLYCIDNGRPATDPVVLFKLLFIGYLYGIRGERQLVKEVQVNVTYRWFLGFSLTDKDTGYMVRDGKPKGFFYLDHRTADGVYNFITDSYAAPANVHDSRP